MPILPVALANLLRCWQIMGKLVAAQIPIVHCWNDILVTDKLLRLDHFDGWLCDEQLHVSTAII